MKIVEPSVSLLWITPYPEQKIEMAGRTCYKSENRITKDSSAEFCRRMVSSGHHAMIEHAVASLRIITDRGVSHEIVRHRIASYAQESTRYCRYSDDKFDNEICVVEPPDLDTAQRNNWLVWCHAAEDSYKDMLVFGASPQIARSVLPTCLKTELVMTANFREWRHFIKLRSSKAAHPQIRPIAQLVLHELMDHAPNVFYDLIEEVYA